MSDYSISTRPNPDFSDRIPPSPSKLQQPRVQASQIVDSSAVDSDQSRLDTSAGRAEVKVAFWGDSFEGVSSIPKIHGLAQGDSLSISGTGVSGQMSIQRWNKDELSVSTEMDGGMLASIVEQATGKEPVLKNGKMNLSFQVTKNGDKFMYSLKDANSPGNATLLDGPVEVLQDSKKKKIRLKTDSVEMTLTIDEAKASSVNGSGSLSLGLLPLPGFSFYKN